MKKKLLSIFFVFLISVLSFSAKVNDVKFSANKFIINLNAADGECLVSADEESRLIYIEIQNLNSSSFEKFSRNLSESAERKMEFFFLRIKLKTSYPI